MSEERIDIVISYNDGAKVIKRDLEDLGTAAEKAGNSVQRANDGMLGSAEKLAKSQASILDKLSEYTNGYTAKHNKALAMIRAANENLVAGSAQHSAVLTAANAAILAETTKGAGHIKNLSQIIRESFVIMREAVRGDTTRMAGSVSILIQAFGLLAPALLPFTLAAVGTIGVIAALTYEINKLTNQRGLLVSTLAATGNAAALTADGFKMMEVAISSASGVQRSHVREALNELVLSGQFTRTELQNIALSASKLAQMTGKSVEEMTKYFEKAADAPGKFASEYMKHYKGLTVADVEHIQQLEKMGKKQEAVDFTTAKLADSFKNQMSPELSKLSRHIKEVTEGFHALFDQLDKTDGEKAADRLYGKLASVTDKIAQLKDAGISPKELDRSGLVQEQAHLQSLVKLDQINNQIMQNKANKDAEETNRQRKGTEALDVLTAKMDKYGKTINEAAEQMKILDEAAAALEAVNPNSPKLAQYRAERPQIEQRVKKSFDPIGTKQEDVLAKVNQSLQEESALYGKVGEAREIQQKMNAIDMQFLSAKKTLQGAEREEIQAKVAASVKMAEVDKVVVSMYNQVQGPQRNYTNALAAANLLLKEGVITQAEYGQQLSRAKKEFMESSNPLAALEREMDRQMSTLRLTNKEMQIENQLYEIQESHKAKGKQLTDAESAALREKLVLMQREQELSSARNQIYDATAGKIEKELYFEQALAEKMKGSAQDKLDAKQAFYLAHQTELEGTQDAYNVKVRLMRQENAIMDAAVKGQVISAQSANTAKLRNFMAMHSAELRNMSDTFGLMSSLMSSHNKKLFAVGKAAAITQSIINTFEASTKALTAGPIIGPILAAATVVQGMMSVAQIRAQQPPAFAFGGEMAVGGVGGTDSQLVSMRATPGEIIRVTTPMQEREKERGAGAGGDTFIFHMPGVTKEREVREATSTMTTQVAHVAARAGRYS